MSESSLPSPSPSSLSAYAHACFCEAFGDPHSSLGRDHHWALILSPGLVPISVLMNGTLETPNVWVFDSHDGLEGVSSAALTEKSGVALIIAKIRERVKRANGGGKSRDEGVA